MCGIFVSIGFVPEKWRLDIIEHRGPDGEGWEIHSTPNGPLCLGHRRLSIVDLSDNGKQPMKEKTGRYRIVFNGEIYNYIEIRNELVQKGYVFSSSTDTEVLLNSYVEWGVDCLSKFIGMFSFVIWDEVDCSLFVARDRFGVKPLYYVSTSSGVAFASEIKQLQGLGGLGHSPNLLRVRDFLASGISNHTSETLFEGIFQLRGGECALISVSGGSAARPKIWRWYDVPPLQIRERNDQEAADEFRGLLTESVRLHMRSDVPVGSCLSGGLDSSAIVCLASELMHNEGKERRVSTFSACFDEKYVDERPFMDAVIAHTDASPTFVFPKPDDLVNEVSQMMWHQDEPFGSTSIFAQWLVFKAARGAGIPVMLDGQGADEPLAGYHSSFFYLLQDKLRSGNIISLLATIADRKRLHGLPIVSQLQGIPGLQGLASLIPGAKANSLPPVRNWLDGEAYRDLPPLGSVFDSAVEFSNLPPVKDVPSLSLAMTFAGSLQTLLQYEDRNSMAHSIEARVPFLDHRIVEFVLSLRADQRIRRATTKYIMRSGLKNVFPEKIKNRNDKLGFATPEEKWFKGDLRNFVVDSVESSIDLFPSIFDGDQVRLLLEDYMSGARKFDFTLWRIANLSFWHERMRVSA